MNCPHCGAPANVTPGVPTYDCPFCKRSFSTMPQQPAAPPPSALPPGDPPLPAYGAPPAYGAAPAPPPQIVVIAPGGGGGRPLRVRGSSGFGWLVPFLVIGLLVGTVGGLRWWWTGNANLWSGGFGWDGKEPLDCAGNDQVDVKGINANLPGTAINASGNCKVKIVDSTIKADTVVEASGNAEVTFQGGTVDGKVAADAAGNARVHFQGTKVTGEKKRGGNAKVD